MATLNVQKREGAGKYHSFSLRKAGNIPGVVYGKGMEENINVTLNLKEFVAIVKAGERLIDLDFGPSKMRVLLKAVQHGTYDHEILHVDFRAISENEILEVALEIVLAGEAPGLQVGGMLEQNLHQVTAKCLPKDLPERISVDVSGLNLGDIIYAKDLPKLNGVEYVLHGNPAVVSCHAPREEAPAPAAETEAPTAPGVIGEKEREEKEKSKEKEGKRPEPGKA